MSLTDLEHLAKIFQGFATGAAIVIGAIWALFRFWSLREIKQVKLRIEQQQRELQEQPVLDLTMMTEQVAVEGDDCHYVTVTVLVKNNGTQIARMAYEGRPALRVFSVDYSSDGTPAHHEQQALHVPRALDAEPADSTIVRPGQTVEISFNLNLSATGWYFVAFRAVLSKKDRQELIKAGVPKDHVVIWAAKKYLCVKPA